MENKSNKSVKKCMRKQKRAQRRLTRDANVEYSEEPTQHVAICNAGLVTGLKRETLEQFLEDIVPEHYVVMPTGKSYCFVYFYTIDNSIKFYERVHGNLKVPGQNTCFYLMYIKSIPSPELIIANYLPRGLTLITDFVSPEEEEILLQSIDWEEKEEAENSLSELKHRRVKHFGYKFRYDNNSVDIDDPIKPIPRKYEFLQNLFEKHGCGNFKYDQLTVNRYLPGQGIPPHIDTRSIFEDPILSLSLGSACVMDFKREGKKIEIDLPARSLLVMGGEARYVWTHGICPRHNDNVKVKNGLSTRPRGIRVSFTFRKIRRGDCPSECNTHRPHEEAVPKITKINNSVASLLENAHVHSVYEQISSHFNETRFKQWPKVTKFIEHVETGGLLLDVGCGNGKYLSEHSNVFKMGCDRNTGFAQICQNKGFQIILADSHQIPYKSNILDAVLCIAVIHHFSTSERRKRAISEIMRVLRVGGKALIYVWAKEQIKDSMKSTYLQFNTNKSKEIGKLVMHETQFQSMDSKVILPVHENRTEFSNSDMFVPWKLKDKGEFLRFYHVFEEGELEKLCMEIPSAKAQNVYYDQGNWCIVLEKLQEKKTSDNLIS